MIIQLNLQELSLPQSTAFEDDFLQCSKMEVGASDI